MDRLAPLRPLWAFGPHDAAHLPAARAAVSFVVPLAVLTAAGRVDLSLYAVFGGFAAIYGRGESHRHRLRTQSVAGAALVAAVTCGAAASLAGPASSWVAVVLGGLAAFVGSAVSRAAGWRPPGPLFVVFAAGACAAVPPGDEGATRVLLAAALAAGSAAFAVAVGALGAVHPRWRRTEPAPPLDRRPLRSTAARADALAAAGAALVAGALATAVGQGHAYWAAVSAVVPLAAPTTSARVVRAVHRFAGTVVGLVVAAGLLVLEPTGWWLVLVFGVLQLVAELVVVRNYGVALVAITPLALVMVAAASGAPGETLLVDRLVETALGLVVGLLATGVASSVRRSPA